MPEGSIFIDTNVLLYARDAPSDEKAIAAAGWLRWLAGRGLGRTNLQVLNETTHVLLRKRQDLSAREIFAEVDGLRPFGTTPLTELIVAAARRLRVATSYSWWDCLLLASALELGCTHFLSEDLQDGQRIEDTGGRANRGLTILDPFAHSPAEFQ
jgi:predicted nucleic acid-binding protein